MFYQLTTTILCFLLLTPAFAGPRQLQTAQVVHALVKTPTSPSTLHHKINQWSDLKAAAEDLEDKDREVLLKRLESIEKSPFQKPNLELTPQGFDLVHNDIKIKIDLQKKEISVKDKVFLFEGQNLEKTLLWLESIEATKTSYISWIIPDAHAFLPLLPVAIVILAGALVYLSTPSRKSCLESLNKMRQDVSKAQVECRLVGSNSRKITPRLRDLFKRASAYQGPRGSSCEETLKDAFSFCAGRGWESCISTSDAMNLCRQIGDLQACVNMLRSSRSRLGINTSGRDVKKELSRERTQPRSGSRAIQD